MTRLSFFKITYKNDLENAGSVMGIVMLIADNDYFLQQLMSGFNEFNALRENYLGRHKWRPYDLICMESSEITLLRRIAALRGCVSPLAYFAVPVRHILLSGKQCSTTRRPPR